MNSEKFIKTQRYEFPGWRNVKTGFVNKAKIIKFSLDLPYEATILDVFEYDIDDKWEPCMWIVFNLRFENTLIKRHFVVVPDECVFVDDSLFKHIKTFVTETYLVWHLFEDILLSRDNQTKEIKMFDVNSIAKIAHEVNRAYCFALDDDSQLKWENAPDWQKDSCLSGVNFHLANPNATPADSHNNWLAQKEKEGWSHGEVKDVEKKEHPCFMPYNDLPVEQKVKDSLFIAVVTQLREFM